MKNAIQKLPAALAACASLLVLYTAAHAEVLTATGNVASTTCVLTFYPSTTPTTAKTIIAMPNLTTADFGTAAGPLLTGSTVDIAIKAQTATGTACTATQGATNAALNSFNTTFKGASDVDVPSKIKNSVVTVSGGATAATGVTFDLVSKPATGTGTSVDITKSSPADQHGLAAAALAAGQTFTVQWYRTFATATTPTTGTVIANYTVSSFYQ